MLLADRTVYQILYAPESVPEPPRGPFGVECFPGHAAIEMVPAITRLGSLYLPQGYAQETRSDAGYVLSAGEGVDLKPQDLVLVAYGHGLRVRDYENPLYSSREWAQQVTGDRNVHGSVVFTGCAGGEMISDDYGDADQPCFPVPWWESIVAVREDGEWVPCGRKVRLKLAPTGRSGNIALVRKRYEPEAKVLAIGSKAFFDPSGQFRGMDVKAGDTVVYDEGGILEIVGEDEVIVDDFAVHCKVL